MKRRVFGIELYDSIGLAIFKFDSKFRHQMYFRVCVEAPFFDAISRLRFRRTFAMILPARTFVGREGAGAWPHSRSVRSNWWTTWKIISMSMDTLPPLRK